MMRQKVVRVVLLAGALLIPLALWSAPAAEAGKATAAPDQTARIAELRQGIEGTLQARDEALRDLQMRYQEAALENRVALEAEGARLQADYEHAYLTLLVEYHRLTGNAVEQQRAEAMLEALERIQSGTPVELKKVELPPVQSGQEGVVTDAQN